MRWRLLRQGALLFVVWPVPILVAPLSGDDRLIPLFARVVFVGIPVLLPLNVWAAVTALRIHRTLSAHPWRRVDCEVVPVSSHGWRLRAHEAQPDGREVKVPAVLRFGDEVLTAAPFKRYVGVTVTQVWCASHPRHGGVVAEPGGARPFRLVRYKGRVH
ncbi:hypothetical protein [Streptomyces sp. NPDC006012]|uniref:hypothetical protein n=1 Tax=Streptomyces sp. NPDC006012 TaxID=3364739 RepID=UPI00368E1CE0